MNDIDKKIARKIADSFEEYADGLENQGWAELRKKYPPRRDTKPLIWWFSAAAVVLISLTTALYFINKPDKPHTFAAKPQAKPTGKSIDSAGSSALAENDAAPVAKNGVRLKNNEIKPTTPGNTGKDDLITSNSTSDVKEHPVAKEQVIVTEQPLTAKREAFAQHASDKKIQTASGTLTAPPAIERYERSVFPYQAAIQHPDLRGLQGTLSTQPLFTLPKPLSIPRLVDTSQEMLAANENNVPKDSPEDSKPSFDIYTSAFLNYTEKSTVPINAGAGFNASVPLAKRLDLVIGGGISNNTAHFGQNNVPMSISSNYSDSKQSIVGGGSLNQAPTNETFDAQLVALDFPIALKLYLLQDRKLYLITGINSSSYLSERYTYRSSSYNLQNFAPNPDQVSKSSFSSFDLGGSGIFGFGFQAQLGKTPLLFETYYKPAFSGLGQRDIKINTAGINLRIPFKKLK